MASKGAECTDSLEDDDNSFLAPRRPHEYLSSRFVGWSNCSTPRRGEPDSPRMPAMTFTSTTKDVEFLTSESLSYEDTRQFFVKEDSAQALRNPEDLAFILLNSSSLKRFGSFQQSNLPSSKTDETAAEGKTTGSTLSRTSMTFGDRDDEQVQQRAAEPGEWLQPAIQRANEGLVTTATLMMGFGAVKSTVPLILVGGVSGFVAGACSMAIAEYVSVSSHRDYVQKAHVRRKEQRTEDVQDRSQLHEHSRDNVHTESTPRNLKEVHHENHINDLRRYKVQTAHDQWKGDLHDQNQLNSPRKNARNPRGQRKDCRKQFNDNENFKVERLTELYLNKGLSYTLANQVARELLRKNDDDAEDDDLANPWEAAVKSALAFSAGAAITLVPAFFIAGDPWKLVVLGGTSIVAFAGFGAIGAFLRSAPVLTSSIRTTVGGCSAMGIAFGLMKLLTTRFSGL